MVATAILTRRIIPALGAWLLLFLAVISAGATPYADYQHRVSEAIMTLRQLELAQDDAGAATFISRLKSELPEKETVQFEGRSVVINNAWLHDALNEVQRKHRGETSRANLLARIGERLMALNERLHESEAASSSRNPDEDKGRLAEILRRPEYNHAPVEGSIVERLWARFLRWLISLIPKSQGLQPGGSPLLSVIAQVVVVAAGLALIAFAIWKFLPRYLRSRGKKKVKREARIVLGERLEPDQSSADLLAQAEALARAGDLRAAIRKAYIAFLCELADRKVISLAQYKTNRDYLNSVRERAVLHSAMRKLTSSFERHWYGFVPARENDWTEFRTSYQQALKTSPGPG